MKAAVVLISQKARFGPIYRPAARARQDAH